MGPSRVGLAVLSALCFFTPSCRNSDRVRRTDVDQPVHAEHAVSSAVETALDLPVNDSVDLDVTPLNAASRAAAEAGETWPRDPLRTVLEHAGDLTGRIAAVVREDGPGEVASTTVITVVREGLMDDSVRAVWEQMTLAREADGTWAVTSWRRAYRCRRGDRTDAFGAEPCP